MADQNTVRTLTVRQIQDASAYVSGAREFVAANKDMASSSSIVGAVVSQTQAKISSAADPISRLVRAYDQSSASSIKFSNELSVLNKQLETGKFSADEAGRVYAGMVKSFGMAADGADLMAQGFIKLGGVVAGTNDQLREIAAAAAAAASAASELERLTQGAISLRAALDPAGAAFSRLNVELTDHVRMLQLGLINSEEFAKAQDMARVKNDAFIASLSRTPANDFGDKYARQAATLLDVLDPAAASQRRLNAQISEYTTLLNLGEISTQQFAQAEDLARSKHDAFIASLNATPDSKLTASYGGQAQRAREEQAQDIARGNFDRLLGVGQPIANPASSSAAIFEAEARAKEEDARATNALAASAAALRAQIDPVGASQLRLNTQLEEYTTLLRTGTIGLGEFTRAELLARQRHDEFVTSLNRTPVNDNDLGRNPASYRTQNLGQQLLDSGQTAALGAPLGTIALQQGPQIAGIYAMEGGIKALLADLSSIARVAGPVAVIIATIYGAYKILEANSAEAALSVSEATKALAAQAAPIGSLQGQIDDLQKLQTAYSDAILSTATTQDGATKGIIANSQREFEAKRSLLEIELKRQEAAQKLQESLIAIEGLHLKQEIGNQFNQPAISPVAQGYADPKINGGIPFVRMPDEVTGMEKLNEIISNSPAADKIKEMRAESTLLDIAVDKLREGLTLTFKAGSDLINQGNGVGPGSSTFSQAKAYTDAMEKVQAYYRSVYNPPNVDISRVPVPELRPTNPGAGYAPIDSDPDKETKTESAYDRLIATVDRRIKQQQLEIQLAGMSAEAASRLRVEEELVAQAEEDLARSGDKNAKLAPEQEKAIRAKADALARYQQIAAGQKFDQGQQDQIAALQLQADMIGKSANEQARMNAVFQAEQQMRQQGLSLLGEEADRRRAVAAAIADSSQEIQRQQAAYQSLQQAEGSAIDTLITGTGSAKDRLKSLADDAAKWLLQMSVANPLKNAWTGTNLPTIADLFSGKPSVPGASSASTAMMNVQATTVMINGGVAGLPGVPSGGGLGGLLGYTPTNANNSSPFAGATATVGGMLNPANQNVVPGGSPPTDIEAYIRQAAISRGIDPNVAVRVAQSEGGLTSWNRQSDFVNSAGVREQSYGPYQLYMNGGLGNQFQQQTGLDPRLAQNGPAGIDFSLDYAKRNGWGSWYGADRVGIDKWEGINKGSQPIAAEQANASLLKLSQTTSSATKDLGGLGDTSTKLGTTLSDVLGGTGKSSMPSNYFPPAPTSLPSNYFPPAPSTGGFNPFSLLTSIFSLFGFADGTDFSPGGLAWVGERGRELVNLPRGSKVTPNHKLNDVAQGGGQKVSHTHEWNVTVSGNGDKELMGRMQIAADQSFKAMMTDFNDNELPARVQFINQNPWSVG